MCKRGEKKRLGLVAFYDIEGICDSYFLYLLHSLSSILNDIIVIVNGEIKEDSYNNINDIVGKVIVRDNVGYDGGAFKDVIMNHIGIEGLKEWDELLLTNNSYYGPLNGWNDIFDKMCRARADFWGLTASHPRYKGNVDKKKHLLPYHIQSYFLVCRKRMLQGEPFRNFWLELDYPKTFYDAVCDYEVALTRTMIDAGYSCTSYIDEMYPQQGSLSYAGDICQLIIECKFPVVKKKVFSDYYITIHNDIFKTITEKSDYSINMILEHNERIKQSLAQSSMLDIEALRKFCNGYNRIYIYGHGKIGKHIRGILEYLKIKDNGFLVTEQKSVDSIECRVFEKKIVQKDVGIIVGLSYSNMSEVCSSVLKDIDQKQIFRLNY